MQRAVAVVLLLASVASVVLGYPKFKDAIPNGHIVPNPCFATKPAQGAVWGGVGHKNISGGGDLNPFGDTFKANNFTFTQAVCMADSDGDGLTNGQELGDPACKWAVGKPTEHGPRGHPGICEPVGSQWCQNSWFSC